MTEPLSLAQAQRLITAIFGIAPIQIPMVFAVEAAIVVGGESAERLRDYELTAAEFKRGRTYKVAFPWRLP